MSDSHDPIERRRVPRWPLLAAVVVFALIVVTGAVWSNNERATRLAGTSPTTSSTLVNDTAPSAPTGTSANSGTTAPAVTAGTSAPAATVTTNAQQASSCTESALLAAVKNSGQIDPSIAGSIRVTEMVCAEPYARAHLETSGADPVDAYLSNASGSWRLLTLGTAIDPGAIGIPRAAAEKLKA